MKRLLALLLLTAMILSLSACGGAKSGSTAAAEPAAAASPATQDGGVLQNGSAEDQPAQAQPEKVYASVGRKLLVRETRRGDPKPNETAYVRLGSIFDRVTEYSYDEFGEKTGETVYYVYPTDSVPPEEAGLDDYHYEHDDAGKLVRVTWNGDNIFGKQEIRGVEYEDGRQVRSFSNLAGTETVIEETRYTYGPNGQVTQETGNKYYDLWNYFKRYPQPITDTYDYDAEGRCIRWAHEEKDFSTEVTCVYDGSGNIVETKIDRGKNGVSHYEKRYDGENRLIGVTRTFPGGDVAEYSYQYDQEGRPLSEEVEIPGAKIRIDFSYNDQGFLSRAEWFADEKPYTVMEYAYEEDDYGYTTGRIVSGSSGPDPFSYSGSTVAIPSSVDEDGDPYWTAEYSLKIFGVDLCYVEDTTYYEYENRSVKIEVTPAAAGSEQERQTAAVAPSDELAAYYPELPAKLCGLPLPSPDGSKRLKEIRVDPGITEINLLAKFRYDESGKLADVEYHFDPTGSYDPNVIYSGGIETDEQGRLTRFGFNDGSAVQFRYGDDPDVYTCIQSNGYESERHLEDYRIPDWIRQDLADFDYTKEFTLNEDGLPVSGTLQGRTVNRDYRAAVDGNGRMKAIEYHGDNFGSDDYYMPLLQFDENGCLTFFRKGFYKNWSVTYIYE